MKIRRALRIILIGCIGASIAFITFFIPEKYHPFLVVTALVCVFVELVLIRPAWLMLSVAVFSPFACMIRQFEAVTIAGTTVSASAVAWVLFAGCCTWFLASHPSRTRIPKFSIPFLAFTGWTFLRWLTASASLSGLKDVLFYGLPPLFCIFTLWLLARGSGGLMSTMENLLLLSVFIPVFLYALAVPLGWISFTDLGPVGVIGSRGTALYLLVVLGLALSRWSYSTTANAKNTSMAILLLALGTIAFTLSRMAGVTALLLLALAVIKPHRIREGLTAVIAAGLVGAVLVLTVPILRERFFHDPSSDLWSTLLSLRMAGRDLNWSVTFEHAIRNPFIGWGPGSARLIVAENHPWSTLTEYHPHNEYLEVFHDTGAVGLTLLLMGYIPLCVRFWKKWGESHAGGNRILAARHMAAFLCLTAVLVTSVTSNTLHYAFVTVPAFILVAFAYYQEKSAADAAADAAAA
jgi:O-antigen ligase